MKRKIVFTIMVLMLLFVGSNSQGQDAPGGSDHPMISRYTGSIIDGYEVFEFNEFYRSAQPLRIRRVTASHPRKRFWKEKSHASSTEDPRVEQP